MGLANIVQRVKLAISTPKGSLLQHPNFGFGLPLGDSTADITAKDILKAAQNLFKGDPTFTGVKNVVVQKIGPVLRITMTVSIAGSSQLIPISVDIQR